MPRRLEQESKWIKRTDVENTPGLLRDSALDASKSAADKEGVNHWVNRRTRPVSTPSSVTQKSLSPVPDLSTKDETGTSAWPKGSSLVRPSQSHTLITRLSLSISRTTNSPYLFHTGFRHFLMTSV